MRTLFPALRRYSTALRMLLVLTVILGVGYPLLITAVAQIPGLKSRADASIVKVDGKPVGSALLGQSFTDKDGNALVQYFQSRPSAAGYNATASSPSNLGPESDVDTLPDPKVKDDSGTQSLLTQVCARSLAVGTLEHVSGARPFCTSDGVGAVLAVFYSAAGYKGHVTHAVSVNQACPAKPFITSYQGAPVTCATYGADYSKGKIVPVRGNAPAHPAVPADAVTASGSGLDPEISLAYARLQEPRIAKARGISVHAVTVEVNAIETGRDLGFMGEEKVNVLKLNIALDAKYPYAGK